MELGSCRLLTISLYLIAAIVSFPGIRVASAGTVDTKSPDEAQRLMDTGRSSFASGRFGAAARAWRDAARRYATAGDSRGRVTALLRQGAAELALGKVTQGVASSKMAFELAQAAEDVDLAAGAASNLGNAYLELGRDREAERLIRTSIELATKAGAPVTAATALNNLGNLLAARADFEEAKGVYRDGLARATAIGNRALVAKVAVNLARVSLHIDQAEGRNKVLVEAMDRLGELEASHDKAYGLISLGRVLEQANRPPERVVAAYRQAADTAEAIGDARAQSYALGYLGRLYESAGRDGDALVLSRGAIEAARRADAPESLYRWQWQTGRLLSTQGNIEHAIAAYQRAVYTLQSVRQDLAADRTTEADSFRKRFGSLYLELADLLLQRSAAVADAGRTEGYLREARETVELLKGAELEDYFQDDCATALRARTAGIDRLAARTAAVYPVILEDRLEILLSLPGGMKRFSSPVGAEVFVREVRALRRRLEKRTTHQYLPHAKRIYDWLVRPLEQELARQRINTLVFVPDGALRTIPMAVLHDGKRFLVARYALATTPGLTLTDPRPIARDRAELLLSGLTDSVQGFPALPHVAEELAEIETLYGGTVLKNRQFVAPQVESRLKERPYSIVHIASHGQFDKDISKTFLLTYDDKLNMDALERYMGLTRFRKNPVELLTLSACQTAAGDDRAALGLAGVAVKAGARSALATLWFISDRASATLVAEFYRQLKDPSRTKAQALRQAQLTLMKDRRYRHPGYWSPYLLIGNWL